MKDRLGNEVEVGDTIAYAGWRAELHFGVVEAKVNGFGPWNRNHEVLKVRRDQSKEYWDKDKKDKLVTLSSPTFVILKKAKEQ